MDKQPILVVERYVTSNYVWYIVNNSITKKTASTTVPVFVLDVRRHGGLIAAGVSLFTTPIFQ